MSQFYDSFLKGIRVGGTFKNHQLESRFNVRVRGSVLVLKHCKSLFLNVHASILEFKRSAVCDETRYEKPPLTTRTIRAIHNSVIEGGDNWDRSFQVFFLLQSYFFSYHLL